eukprot:66673-Rhodomonas_salina.8
MTINVSDASSRVAYRRCGVPQKDRNSVRFGASVIEGHLDLLLAPYAASVLDIAWRVRRQWRSSLPPAVQTLSSTDENTSPGRSKTHVSTAHRIAKAGHRRGICNLTHDDIRIGEISGSTAQYVSAGRIAACA